MTRVPETEALPAGIDRRGRIRRLSVRGLGVAGAAFLLFPIAIVLFHHYVAFFFAALLAGLTGLVSFLGLVVANARSGPVRLSERAVVEGSAARLLGSRARVLPFSEVVQGWREDPDRVHLAMKNGDVLVVKVESVAEGDRVLRAAGVTATERVLRVPLASAASQIPGGSLFGGVVLAVFGSALFMAFATLAYGAREMIGTLSALDIGVFTLFVLIASLLAFAVYGALSALRRREAVVGADGIAYRRTLRTEHIPYGSLAAVELDTRGVRLVLKGGRKILLPTRGATGRPLPLAPHSAPARTPAEAQRRVIVERIAAAMAAGGGTGLSQIALDQLDRAGRSKETWQGDLGRLLSPEGDYRSARISPEDLGALIEDPSAPVERRVAAAVALGARERDEARRRVRIAIQASADDDLRGALEAAAEGEIAEVPLGKAAARRV